MKITSATIACFLTFIASLTFLADNDLIPLKALATFSYGQLTASPSPEQALRLDTASPYRWCNLGELLGISGQSEDGAYCIRRAAELGHNIPPVLMRVANFHFGRGEHEAAFDSTTRVLELVSGYDGIIFSYYHRLSIPVSHVLSRGLPPGARAQRSYFHYLLRWGAPDDADLAWAALAENSCNDDKLAGEYVQYLIGRRLYDRAVETWAHQLGDRRGEYQYSTYLCNGGFEQEPSGTPLDWRIAATPGVMATRDAETAYEGRYSLKLQFDGERNIAYRHTAQSACLRPGRYRFQAFARTSELTTDQGIFFRIFDPESPRRLDIRTAPLRGTNDWTRLEATFTVTAPTALVTVQLCRNSSLKIDNKIRGEAWLDGVSLWWARQDSNL